MKNSSQAFRNRQRAQDLAQFEIPKKMKRNEPVPDYFAHFKSIKRISPVNLKRHHELLKLCSRDRSKLEGMYLALIAAQNEEVKERAHYNRPQREALIEQCSGFISDRRILLFGMNENLGGKVTAYDEYEDVLKDKNEYDLVLVGNLVDVYKSLPCIVFERMLREDFQKGQENYEFREGAIQKARDLLQKERGAMEEAIIGKLEDLFIESAVQKFDYFYPDLAGEAHQEKVDRVKGLIPWRIAFAENAREYVKANFEIMCRNKFPELFGHILPDVIAQIEAENPVDVFYERLNKKGMIIFAASSAGYEKPEEDEQLIDTGELLDFVGEKRIGRAHYAALTPRFKK